MKAPNMQHWAGFVQSEHKNQKTRKLTRTMIRTIAGYDLISEGDKILVAVSGGKDSYTLVDLLWQAKRKAPFSFDIIAVHLDQAQPGYNGKSLQQWFEKSEIPFQILHEDTYTTVKANTKEGRAYCSLCSRLRRGILYTAAHKLGCNKIALGHHRDDTLETLLLNLFYAGKLQAMPAKYRTDDGGLEVIRPLIECSEQEILSHANRLAYPILPCNLCGSQDGLKRITMKKLLKNLECDIPDLRSVMLHALQNIQPTHMLDKDVAKAWQQREKSIRPEKLTPRKLGKFCGEIVSISSKNTAVPILNNP